MEIDFALLRQNAGDAIPVLIEQIAPDDDRDHLVENVRELCRCFVNIAASTLLLEGRSQPYFLNLCRAAENWRRLLVHLKLRNHSPPPASWGLTPLAGVIAAGDQELAARLSEHLTSLWQPDEEYASEFAWTSTLGALALQARGVEPGPSIEYLAEVSREPCWPALAQALVRVDARAFIAAFDEALALHEARTEERARGFTAREEHFGAHRYLWFEGLALLRLSRQRGLALPEARYRYCPPLAQVPMTERYQGDWVASIGDTVRSGGN